MIKWKIKKEKLENLKFHESNPRKFTEKGLKDLKQSIKNCGDANIITINADNTVLGGHARLTIMKEMGITEVDVKYPTELLSEEQCKEVLIRLNANNAGEWDLDKLEENFDLSELSEWGLDVKPKKEKDKEGEIEFTEELLEEHNYVVLYFDNKSDWLSAVEKLNIHSVQALDSKENYKRVGIGRVIRGAEVIDRLVD